MPWSTDTAIKQIDGLLLRAGLQPGEFPPWEQFRDFTDSQLAALVSALSAAPDRLTPVGSSYRQRMTEALSRYDKWESASTLVLVVAVLNALREDFAAGYATSVEELVHADVFGDFLEIADELLGKGYKDAAAVIGGSVLEEHLRKLASKSQLPTEDSNGRPLKADTINADLAKASVYNKTEQKQVTAWLGLRNDAAHGHYDQYDQARVRLMLDGVTAFVVKYQA